MKRLEPRHIHHLEACQAWIELGEYRRAVAELDRLTPQLRLQPEVLEPRAVIACKLESWQECLELASVLIQLVPQRSLGWLHRSFALHELGHTREAAELLKPALALFPKDWMIRYNLACYACHLADVEEAWRWLEAAYNLGDPVEVARVAPAGRELKPFWAEPAVV